MARGLRLAVLGFVYWGLAFSAASPVAAQTAYPEVMTLEQAAAFLGVNRAYLGQLAAWGQVPGRQIGEHWRFSCNALLNWLAGSYTTPQPITPAMVYGCGSTVARTGISSSRGPAPETIPGRAPVTAPRTAPGTAPVITAGSAPIGEAPEAETADDVFLRDQRLLLGAGDVTLEFGLFYARSDDQLFVESAGSVTLGLVERDSFVSSLTLRYGLFPDTELFASGSLRRAGSQTFAGANEVASTTDTSFGDIALGLRETVIHEGLGVPDVILTLQGGIPTGDSSFSLGGGVALIKSFDPVVLFANVSYSHVFARDFADTTLLTAENRLDTTLGFAFALNDTLSLSSALSGVFTGETVFTNATLRRRESFSLRFGLTSLLASGFYIEPTVSFNLNGDGNDVVIGLSMPYTFPQGP